jgi:uncharacterized protein
MTLDRLVLVPLAVGHLALFVLVMNVVHGLGYSERVMSRAKLWLLALFAVGSGILGWEIVEGSVRAWSWPSFVYACVCVVTGVLVFPLFSAYLHLRPRPEGVAGRTTEVDLAAAHGRDALTGKGKHAWMIRLPRNESLLLRKIEWDVVIPGLSPQLDGLSILHLSDIHLARCFDRRYFEAVFDEAAGMEADLVLATGDIVDDEATHEWVVPLFGRLRGRSGSLAILGNHDYRHRPAAVLAELSAAGFAPIEGHWATVAHAGRTIVLGGTSYPWGPRLTNDDRPTGDLQILLSHAPDLFYWAERAGFHLMLSGHNHGGQVRLPLVGSVFMPSIYSRRFDRGYFRRNGLTLHVSQGVAGMHPIRYGCVPEISRLVLRWAAIPDSGSEGGDRALAHDARA